MRIRSTRRFSNIINPRNIIEGQSQWIYHAAIISSSSSLWFIFPASKAFTFSRLGQDLAKWGPPQVQQPLELPSLFFGLSLSFVHFLRLSFFYSPFLSSFFLVFEVEGTSIKGRVVRKSTNESAAAIAPSISLTFCLRSSYWAQPYIPKMKLCNLYSSDMFWMSNIT